MSNELELNKEAYGSMLKQAIEQIRTTRVIIAKQINSATQSVYWNLGKLLFEKQLSIDLKNESPEWVFRPAICGI